jgi:hypothetical protein
VDVDVTVGADEVRISVGNISEVIEAVAVGEGVAVSTSREKARLVLVEASRLVLVETACLILVDIMIIECKEKNVGV